MPKAMHHSGQAGPAGQAPKSAIIGIVAPEEPSSAWESWTSSVTRMIRRKVNANGASSRSLFLPGLGLSDGSFLNLVYDFVMGGLDAVIIVGVYHYNGLNDEISKLLSMTDVPIVFITNQDYQLPITTIYYDSCNSGFQAAWHLLKTGYQPLLFVAPYDDDWQEERIESARSAIRLSGYKDDILHVYRHSEELGKHIEYELNSRGEVIPSNLDSISQMPGYPSATAAFADGMVFEAESGVTRPKWGIIAANDSLAYGVIQAAGQLNKTVTKDYGIVGFDDLPFSAQIGLTSLRPPLDILGKEAANQAFRLAANESGPQSITVRAYLMIRSSTASSNDSADI